ncbi:MAG TPA: serine O-acetyltransferase EpsC [Bacteroidota bacterium]|nr:serine O-acetyltransferase EpsC [Bacteroidota bacterium]
MNNEFIERLIAVRQARHLQLPVKSKAYDFADNLLRLLFPHFSEELLEETGDVAARMQLLRRDLKSALQPLEPQMELSVDEAAAQFFESLPGVYADLWEDAEAINSGDPASESVDEVISAYPGFYAIAVYRIAHQFYCLRVPIFPRILSEFAHQKTGIDIHPGAKIGKAFCIDHGTGIVIGETSSIGDRVKIYQGVTLGALSVDKSLGATKRHPTIEHDVVIYSNATILGGTTIIGHGSVIGGNVWLTESVPAHSLVYHKSQVRVKNVNETSDVIDFSI